jgi:CRISPR-associated endonuclease/helicase Cas3
MTTDGPPQFKHPAETTALFARYWGKADPALAAVAPGHHTILGHSLDVAACAYVLVDRHPVLKRQLSRCSGIPEDAVALTFAAVCAIHDVGKFDTRFQRKAPEIADAIRPESADSRATTSYDHGTEGFRQIDADDIASTTLAHRIGPAALPLLRAVCGHHGTFPSNDEPNAGWTTVKPSLRQEDARVRRLFIDSLLDFFVAQGANLPWPAVANGPLVQRLGGLCAIADWVGSNVAYFPYRPVPRDLARYWADACESASIACQQSGLIRATSIERTFDDLFPGYAPRDVQILTESLDLTGPALIVVEAEMGKGKTEAALSIAARYLGGGVADGITVALPTMATSNAMFTRVDALAAHMFPGAEVQLGLAHGRAPRNLRFQELVEHSLRAHDPDAAEASVMCARWLLNRKRILLAQIGVGTIDQALQAALVVRHQFVRMFGLSRNVVIIDEVHAYDAYMEVLLEHLLAWLGALGVPVVLLSATLPSDRRAALAAAWVGARPDQVTALDDLPVASSQPYPLVTVTTRTADADTSGTTRRLSLPAGAATSSRTVALERAFRRTEDVAHVEEVAERLVLAARAGARVVWIRNTVREAQRAYRAVIARAGGVEHQLFHARFRGCDRSQIEHAVLRDFGKTALAGGRVLIATQVVEQSLDLDFDELHTDLAPVDLLLQRAGRLHRHQRVRPNGFDQARLVVYVPLEEDAAALHFGPSQYVYDVGTLWIANRALRSRETISLPRDIRPLVEETYHPASRAALLPEGGPRLVAAEERRRLEIEGKRTKARRCGIPPTTADPDGGGALDDDDDAVQAFTRDGSSVTVLPFWWDGESARAVDATVDDAPWNVSAETPDAWRLVSVLVDQTLSIPARGDADGTPLESSVAWDLWKKRFRRFAEEGGLGRRVVPLPLKRDGDTHRGWLHMGGRRRRVQYTRAFGLLMPSEKDEEQQR